MNAVNNREELDFMIKFAKLHDDIYNTFMSNRDKYSGVDSETTKTKEELIEEILNLYAKLLKK